MSNPQTDLVVEFKLGPEGKMPTKAHPDDAGYDLYAASDAIFEDNYIAYKTDLFVSIPPGWVGHIYPRSSNTKMDLVLGNSVGTIDAGYLGEIGFRWKQIPVAREVRVGPIVAGGGPGRTETKLFFGHNIYKKGDKIGQIIFSRVPTVEWKQVDEFSPTSRGEGGWGSSGQ